MSRTSNVSKVVRGLRNYLAIESIAIAIASVMVFGLIEAIVNMMLLKNFTYEAFFMLGMFGPTGILMGIISCLNLRAEKRYISRTAAGELSIDSKSPWARLVIETAVVALSSSVIFLLIEHYARLTTGGKHAYAPIPLLSMAGTMGIVMGLFSYASLRRAKHHIVQALAEIVQGSTPARGSVEVVKRRDTDRSKIEKRLKKWLVLESIGVVIMSVMTFWLIDFVSKNILGRNPLYSGDMDDMIIPMGIIMGLDSYFSLKVASRYLSQLLAGIERVANGKFDTRLEEKSAGPFREVSANFNKMCKELQGVQTLRDDFINNFSHEFKTPITSIYGFSKLLLEESVTDDERRQYLSIIAEESGRLAEMSSNALMLTKLESQLLSADKAPYALDEQIRHCAILLSPQWTKKGLDITADLEPASYSGNADLVQHVWINLLSNAIKFTPEGGKITINLQNERDFLIVTVSDTGKGMTNEEQAHAFEKYYQGDPSGVSKGLGIGLAIAQRIVGLYRGRIEVRSVLKKGSEFTVRLPVLNP